MHSPIGAACVWCRRDGRLNTEMTLSTARATPLCAVFCQADAGNNTARFLFPFRYCQFSTYCMPRTLKEPVICGKFSGLMCHSLLHLQNTSLWRTCTFILMITNKPVHGPIKSYNLCIRHLPGSNNNTAWLVFCNHTVLTLCCRRYMNILLVCASSYINLFCIQCSLFTTSNFIIGYNEFNLPLECRC